MRNLWFTAVCMTVFGATTDGAYRAEIERWRAAYQDKLKAPQGWLAVAGLSWVEQGRNSVGSGERCVVVLPKRFPVQAGELIVRGHDAELTDGAESVKLKAAKDPQEPAKWRGLWIALLIRDNRLAVRIWDPDAETRLHFTGSKWFPISAEYRVNAKFTPYPETRTLPILTVRGWTEDQPAPGYVEFTLKGLPVRLDAVTDEPGKLFFMFRDDTAGHETYHSGRFLDADLPVNGRVILDFNQARNPPCAFTDYATCPIPPRQNWIHARVEAGELQYGQHK